VALAASGVSAATTTVDAFNFGFNARTVKIPLGDSVRWRNQTSTDHTSTANQFNLWNRALPGPSTSTAVSFKRAGTFAYHCAIHPDMKGKVQVRLRVTPTSGTTSTAFVVRVATENAPTGFQHQVQRRRAGQAFAQWMTTTGQTLAFNAPSTGRWDFRARLRRVSDGTVSGWSPVLAVTVN
jgi:plastocyanin